MATKDEIPGYVLGEKLRPDVYLAHRRGRERQRFVVRLVHDVEPGEQQDVATSSRRLRRLRERHLVRVLEVGHQDGLAWVIHERAPGATLRELLQRRGRPLHAADVLALTIQLGQALAALEAGKLLHLGIDPDAVRLGSDGFARLGDFGLGLTPHLAGRLERGRVSLDAIDFVPPEAIEGELAPTPRADVYGLGATLYRCLAGRAPYGGSTLLARLKAVVQDEPPDLRELNPGAPDPVVRLIARFMERDPDDRPLPADVARFAERVARELGLSETGWEIARLQRLYKNASKSGPRTSARLRSGGLVLRLEGGEERFRHELSPGDQVEVGRAQEAGVCLPFRWVSRRHALIECAGSGIVLTDLGSANGSLRNGQPVEDPSPLRTGDLLSFGKSHFEVVVRPLEVAQAVLRCRRCGQRLDPDEPGPPLCRPCAQRQEGDRKDALRRLKRSLETLELVVDRPLPSEGLLVHLRVKRQGSPWLATAAEVGATAARGYARAFRAALELGPHPVRIPVQDVIVREGTLIVLSQAHPGISLHQTVKTGGALSLPEVAELALQLSGAISHLAAVGLGHARIRPELVFLDDRQRVSLLDAALPAALVEAVRARDTLAAKAPVYEAPELEDVRGATARSAVYALGATLVYALGGRPAAEFRRGERRIGGLRTTVEELPRALGHLLAQATSPDPEDRPESPTAFAEELGLVIRQLRDEPGVSGGGSETDELKTQQLDVEKVVQPGKRRRK